jgi:hypothetical protein
VIIFGSIRFLYKKSNQTEIFFKTETGPNRPVLVWFGFLGQKLVQTGLAWFFPVWLFFVLFFWVQVRFVFLVLGL